MISVLLNKGCKAWFAVLDDSGSFEGFWEFQIRMPKSVEGDFIKPLQRGLSNVNHADALTTHMRG